MLIDNDMFWWDCVTVCKVNLHSMRVSLLHVTRPREATEYIVWVLLDNLSELCRLIYDFMSTECLEISVTFNKM